MLNLSDLVGAHVLSGIETGVRAFDDSFWCETSNYIKFTLDGITYMAVEDPDDGYRSYMGEILQVDETCRIRIPDVAVLCSMKDEIDHDILVFRDAINGEIVLEVGTDYTDSYYPYCVMNYHPEKLACNTIRYDSLFE